MGRIWLAIRAFFLILFNADVARRVGEILAAGKLPTPPRETARRPEKVTQPPKPKPSRSDALTLLATLQREARLVDFVKEPLVGYSDAQVGAAARDVHRECGKVLDRLFALKPAVSAEEGAEIEVPAGFEAERYRLTGNVTGEPPFTGKVAHHGWEAGRCEVPAWSGTPSASLVVAPVEVELK